MVVYVVRATEEAIGMKLQDQILHVLKMKNFVQDVCELFKVRMSGAHS